jgi:hypothetical protein
MTAGKALAKGANYCLYGWGRSRNRIFRSLRRGRDGHDRNQIALMAEELPAGIDWRTREPRLRAMTRMLVRRHRTRGLNAWPRRYSRIDP